MKKLVFISCLLLSGCFAYIVVRNGDNQHSYQRPYVEEKVDPEPQVKEEEDLRVQFIKMGAKVVISESLMDGTRVEVYQMPLEKEEVIRSFADGVVEVTDGDEWQFFGTQVESYLFKNNLMLVKVLYGHNNGITNIEIII